MPLPPYIIDPESKLSQIWDIYSLLLLFYVALMVPFNSCFGIENKVASGRWFFDLLVDIFFIFDIFFNLRLAFNDDRGVRQANSKVVACHYLRCV